MSGQLRTLKNRIRSISSTKKITRAMEMVSASKLKRYQKMVQDGAAYSDGLLNMLKRVSSSGAESTHPLLEKRPEKKKALIVFTSDAGLAGSYNQDLITAATKFLKNEAVAPIMIGVGKMGVQFLKKAGNDFEKTFVETKATEIENVIKGIKDTVLDLFMSKKVDAIYATYSRFISASKFQAVTEKILPFTLDVASTKDTQQTADNYIMEPDVNTLFEKLVPAVFSMRVRGLFLESFVSEQMARMNAMHQATENASELIDELVLERNKARQAAITKELIEIISGSQALKA